MALSDRIIELASVLEKKQVDFCKKTGIPTSTLSGYQKNPRDEFHTSKLLQIKKAYPKISLDWLLLGEGDMFLPASSSAVSQNMTFVNGNGNTQIYSPADCAEKLRERDTEIIGLQAQVALLKDLLTSK